MENNEPEEKTTAQLFKAIFIRLLYIFGILFLYNVVICFSFIENLLGEYNDWGRFEPNRFGIILHITFAFMWVTEIIRIVIKTINQFQELFD